MSDHDLVPPDEWRDLLSALLDGELAPDEEDRVRALVAASPEAQEELAALSQVRTLVRDLPAVDPPFGFYERLLRPKRRPRHIGAKVGGAVAAAAAAIVLIVGVTPATDSVVPPVQAYAARHLEMEGDTAVPAGAPGPSTTAPATTTTTEATPETEFAPVPDAELDAMGMPTQLTGDFRRMSGYQSPVGAVHLVYSDGRLMVSVYEQPGVVAWDRMPAGTMVEVDGMTAWTMVDDDEEVMVFERGPVVYTVVAAVTSDAHDEMVGMAVELPEGSDPSMFDRFRTSCRSVAARFSMSTAEP